MEGPWLGGTCAPTPASASCASRTFFRVTKLRTQVAPVHPTWNWTKHNREEGKDLAELKPSEAKLSLADLGPSPSPKTSVPGLGQSRSHQEYAWDGTAWLSS